jgi:hypothetical protein
MHQLGVSDNVEALENHSKLPELHSPSTGLWPMVALLPAGAVCIRLEYRWL